MWLLLRCTYYFVLVNFLSWKRPFCLACVVPTGWVLSKGANARTPSSSLSPSLATSCRSRILLSYTLSDHERSKHLNLFPDARVLFFSDCPLIAARYVRTTLFVIFSGSLMFPYVKMSDVFVEIRVPCFRTSSQTCSKTCCAHWSWTASGTPCPRASLWFQFSR